MNERTVRDAWERFVGGGDAPVAVRSAVASSWERSKNFQVDVGSHGAPVLSEGEIYRKRADNALLTASTRLATQRASQSLTESGSMLILTDGSGHIIETIGDTHTIETGREVHLEHGGCWTEEKIGTNAIGTAMAAMQPVQIHATEHFCADVQRWTCAAAPIFHPIDRELLGVIDIFGPASDVQFPQSGARRFVCRSHRSFDGTIDQKRSRAAFELLSRKATQVGEP